MENNNDFEFKYSAPTSAERKEIESIRNSYIQKDAQSIKLQQLRKLDSKVKNIPTIVALVLGVGGLLIFGLGMSMVLEWNLIVFGIIVSLVGFVPMILAAPVNQMLTKKLKAKYGKQIIELSEELLNENK